MSAFTDRLARRRRRAHDLSIAEADAELVRKMAADPHAEPPSSRSGQRSPPAAKADKPCPAWILRRVRGEARPGDPGIDSDGSEVYRARPWPDDVLPIIERLSVDAISLVAWLDLPPAPFKLTPWVTITDSARWLEDLRCEVDLGPSSARACLGTLQEDLRSLALVLEAAQ